MAVDGDPINPIELGKSFENLEVLEAIGRGGFATVYRAHDRFAQRQVALKVLDAAVWRDDAFTADLGLAEARMVARIHDPHVVMLYNVFEVPGGHWAFALEYMDGGSLAERLKESGALEEDECRRVLVGMLRGLAAAHERRIVHYDIKPANVMLGRDGAVKLTDFGLGRIVADDDRAPSLMGRRRGTALYMAPEVVMGRSAEHASDLWGVGVVLYEMLAGRRPFTGRTDQSLFYEILNASPPPLPLTVSPALAGIALRCLAKAAADRPASAGALLEDLERPVSRGRGLTVDPSVAAAPGLLLAGRESEMATLGSHLEEVQGGAGRAVLVLGEAGIGKTALMQAMGRDARTRGFRWLAARVSSLEGLRRPLVRALRDVITQADLDSRTGGDVLRMLHEEESTRSADLSLQTPGEFQRALAALAEKRPVALLVEDVHLCEPEEIQMLAALGTGLDASPVFVALTYRTRDPTGSDSGDGMPSGYHDLTAAQDLYRIELEPLGDRAVRALLEQTSGFTSLPLDLVERVIHDSEGVPLYALELYRHLEASGEIEPTEDSIRLTPRWKRTKMPRRLRDMVTRRLAGMNEEERTLLETAAVGGVEFDGGRLAEVLDRPALGVLRSLQVMFRTRALVVPLERGYRFGHRLYQEAIYAEMAPDLRRALHRAWAECLAPHAADVDPETLGWHWEQAGFSERAGPYLLSAAIAARGRGEHARTWDLTTRAGALREGATNEELRANFDLLESLDSTLATEEDARRLEALHARLRTAAAALGDEGMRRRTVVAESWHRAYRANSPPVDRAAVEDAAEHLPDSLDRGRALWLLGRMAAHGGDYEGARETLKGAEACFTACGQTRQADDLQHLLGLMHRAVGDVDAARRAFERLADASLAATGRSAQAALSRSMAIVCASQAGRTEGAGDAMDEAIRWMERAQQEARAADMTSVQAELYEAEGRVEDARAALRRAEPTLRRSVLSTAMWNCLLRKARLEVAAGEIEAAAATIEEAPDHAGTLGPVDLAALEERRAFLHVARAEPADARDCILQALEVVTPTSEYRDLSRLLSETIQLALLGVDLSDALPLLRGVFEGPGERPIIVDLPLRVALTVLRRDLGESDASALDRAAATASDPRLGCYQAAMAAFGRLLSARAHLLGGDREAAASVLEEVGRRAQRLGHVWLELRALQLARDADLEVDAFRVRALVELLGERNPADAARTATLVVSWTSGMPRA